MPVSTLFIQYKKHFVDCDANESQSMTTVLKLQHLWNNEKPLACTGAKMRLLLVYMLILLLCGCSEKMCMRPMSAYNTETKTERIVQVEGKCPPDNSFKWYHVLLFPIAILAVGTDTQQAVASSPNYQAGGSAYRDYTQPQNQSQPQPSYQQQQINNGNGAGQYENYPKY